MKYCTYCGSQISDEAKFCLNCGAQQEVQQPNNVASEKEVQQQQYAQRDYSQFYQEPEEEKPKFQMKAAILLVGIVVLVLGVIFVLFKLFASGGSSTMEGAVDEYYEAISDRDGEAFLNITCSDDLTKALKEETGYSKKEMAEELEESIEYEYEDYSKIKNVKIEDKEKLSKSEVKEGLAAMEDEIGADMDISEMYYVKVSFEYYDTYYEEWEEDTEYLLAYKSGSGWYILPSGF